MVTTKQSTLCLVICSVAVILYIFNSNLATITTYDIIWYNHSISRSANASNISSVALNEPNASPLSLHNHITPASQENVTLYKPSRRYIYHHSMWSTRMRTMNRSRVISSRLNISRSHRKRPGGLQSLQSYAHRKRRNRPSEVVADPFWRQQNQHKLIIFLHFHKAGGTSIVNAARPVTVFADPESNGNPREFIERWQPYNYRIQFQLFDLAELAEYVRNLTAHSVSFIAMENVWFKQPEVISALNAMQFMQARARKIELIVQFRNPFTRYVSNFFYELNLIKYRESRLLRKMDIRTRLWAFHDANIRRETFKGIQSWNMYVRTLSRQFEKAYVDESDLVLAKQQLSYFEVITILEIPETWELMAKRYGIQTQLFHSQENTMKRYGHANDTRILAEFEEEFEKLNEYDYLLYNYAVELSRNLLATLKNTTSSQKTT